MNRIRWIGVALILLVGSATHAQPQTQLQTDELTLKALNLPIDAKGLLEFFQSKSMKEGDSTRLPMLVKRLDSTVFAVREPAAKELISRGPVSLPFLNSAVANPPSLETKRRAELCIASIESTMQAEPIAAAARVLTARKDPKAAEVLFHFVPSVVSDPYLEEEVLACVGRLTITPEKVDPLLTSALKDPLSFRRLAAAYLIGRRANPDYRQSLRELLADDDMAVRERVSEGLFGKRPAQMLKEQFTSDQALLRTKNVDLTDAGLVKFFHVRTLSEEDQKKYRGLVKNMGSEVFKVREMSTNLLIKEGPAVLSFLRDAEYDSTVERSRRARNCIEIIQLQNNPALPIAAAHVLARPAQQAGASPAEAIRALLAYIPFVDDDLVEEEILTSLTLLCLREPNLQPELIKALDDPLAARRAAAAFVLGHVGVKQHTVRAEPLLDDLHPNVRFRAAQGMLAARNPKALHSFANLLVSAPAPFLPRIEETLYRVADNGGPTEVISASSTASREKASKAWSKWLVDNTGKIDLTNLDDRQSFLGLVTICEYDNQVGQINGQVWETPRGGQKRWSFGGVMGAMDAHTLPNGRILVAENNQNRVTERDSKGNVVWEYRIPVAPGSSGNPICCQRLPNGNTFIASYQTVMEIKPDKTQVYRYTPGAQFYIFSAHKTRNGDIVAITANNSIITLDSKTGQQKSVVSVQTQGNWSSVEQMPNGNFLVASMATNSVHEVDSKSGQDVWTKQFPGAFRATRLPNGNVLAASMTTKQVVEIDRAGTIRWSVTCQGRPWGVHYR